MADDFLREELSMLDELGKQQYLKIYDLRRRMEALVEILKTTDKTRDLRPLEVFYSGAKELMDGLLIGKPADEESIASIEYFINRWEENIDRAETAQAETLI
jgi:hypothetical protein